MKENDIPEDIGILHTLLMNNLFFDPLVDCFDI